MVISDRINDEHFRRWLFFCVCKFIHLHNRTPFGETIGCEICVVQIHTDPNYHKYFFTFFISTKCVTKKEINQQKRKSYASFTCVNYALNTFSTSTVNDKQHLFLCDYSPPSHKWNLISMQLFLAIISALNRLKQYQRWSMCFLCARQMNERKKREKKKTMNK